MQYHVSIVQLSFIWLSIWTRFSSTDCFHLNHPRSTSRVMGQPVAPLLTKNDDFMEILRQRTERQETQYARLLMEQSKYNVVDDTIILERGQGSTEEQRPLPKSVHIILFHPDTPQQNVHTIEYPKGSGNNILLAFELEEDCRAFAQMLTDLEFVDPSPQETEFQPLVQYCQSIGVSCAVVPTGFDLTPPQLNSDDEAIGVDSREYKYEMYEYDNDVTGGSNDVDSNSWG